MKTWPLIIGILVIHALVCSPVLAISKSDLISQYKTGEYWKPPNQTGEFRWPTIPTPTPNIPSWYVPKPSGLPSGLPYGSSLLETDYWFHVEGWFKKPKWNGSGIRGEIEPQPPPNFGSLEISSDPSGASVYLDVNPWTNEGTFIGTTPFTISVETGLHRVKMTKTGYSGARFTTPAETYYGNDEIEIIVTKGETIKVFAVLISDYTLPTGLL